MTGDHFDNENGKEVIIPPVTDPAIGDRTHTRDPKVWKQGDDWYLILGSTVREEYGEVLFYKSRDLHSWTYVNKAFKGPGYGWMWECPDYFETEGGGVLLLSAMGLLNNGEKERNQSICFPVSFDAAACRMQIPDAYQYLDYGLDLYAPQTTPDEKGPAGAGSLGADARGHGRGMDRHVLYAPRGGDEGRPYLFPHAS